MFLSKEGSSLANPNRLRTIMDDIAQTLRLACPRQAYPAHAWDLRLGTQTEYRR